jgi:hypothetical protein
MVQAITNALDIPVPPGCSHVLIMDMMGGGRSQDADLQGKCGLPHRPNFWFIILASYDYSITGPEGRDEGVKWVRDLWSTLFQLSLGVEREGEKHFLDTHSHVEELVADTLQMGQQSRVKKVYGENTERLNAAKVLYDPLALFGMPILEQD